MSITLTDEEAHLFNILQQLAKKHNVIIRVAGGWVRDKLLQIQNHDIDIAVENMTGAQFANIVHEEMQQIQQINQDANSNTIGRVTVIQANPEQSKFLETATVNILGWQIDFAGLRQEVYTDNSRIPQVTSATAEQDAQRRDFTVNAMFYNLNNQQIEDFVGGIQDLTHNILRTPLEPLKTFYDDPLRMIRCVRFACKLGFNVENTVFEALTNEQAISRLGTVVAKSRFAPEVLAAIEHDPEKALQLFASSIQFLRVIFYDDLNKSIIDENIRLSCQAILNDPNFINYFMQQASTTFMIFNGIKSLYNKEQRGIIGFYVAANTFDKLLNLNGKQISFNAKNIAFYANQKQKQYVLTMIEAIPFLNCLQSMKFTVSVKQLADVFYILSQAQQMENMQQVKQVNNTTVQFSDHIIEFLSKCVKTAKTQLYPLYITNNNPNFNLFIQQIIYALNQLELSHHVMEIVVRLDCCKQIVQYVNNYFKNGVSILIQKFNVNVADVAQKAGLVEFGRTAYSLVKKAVVWQLLMDPNGGSLENINYEEVVVTFHQLKFFTSL